MMNKVGEYNADALKRNVIRIDGHIETIGQAIIKERQLIFENQRMIAQLEQKEGTKTAIDQLRATIDKANNNIILFDNEIKEQQEERFKLQKMIASMEANGDKK